MSLTKLATALTVIFVISLVALIAELLFVLWRRRIFQHQTPPTNTIHDGGGDHQHFPTAESPAAVASSKEQLLFFLCLRTQSRIDSTGAPVQNQIDSSPDDSAIDVFKLLGELHGPSRFLCTIKEEEREGIESDDSAKKSRKVCLQACFEVASAEVADTVEEEGEDVETTPFSTPCASPLYFTPVASPSHEIEYTGTLSTNSR